MFSHYRISPLDASDIKNVYERVWLMTIIEQQEKKKKQEIEDRKREKAEARARKKLSRSLGMAYFMPRCAR